MNAIILYWLNFWFPTITDPPRTPALPDTSKGKNVVASAGNRTRAARVAGEHSTTEPPMLTLKQPHLG